MSKAFVSSARATLVCVTIAFAFNVLIARLFYLHVWEQDALRTYVESNRKVVQVVKSRRGNIVDQRGNLLATTHTRIDLGVDPQSVRAQDRNKLPALAALIGRSLADVERAFDSKTRIGIERAKQVSLIKWASFCLLYTSDAADE